MIYEKTLQAISNCVNTYKGFFIQNAAATADARCQHLRWAVHFHEHHIHHRRLYSSVGDEVVLSGTITEYYYMTELQSPQSRSIQVVRTGVDLDAEVTTVWQTHRSTWRMQIAIGNGCQGCACRSRRNSIVLGGRNVFSPADAEIWVARSDSTIALRTDPYARRAFRDAHPLDDNYDAATGMAMATAS